MSTPIASDTPARKTQWNMALLDSIALAVLILAMCSQVNIADIGKDTYATEGHVTKQLKVALPDVALLLVFGWFVLRTTWMRAWSRLWWPPVACWALIFAMCVAAIHSPTIVTAVADSLGEASRPKAMAKSFITKESKEAIAEIIQFAAYFLFAPLLFVNMIHDRRSGVLLSRRRLALATFAVAVLLSTLLATLQALTVNIDLPRALFATPNAYAGFLAISLPVLVAGAMYKRTNEIPFLILVAVAILLAIFTIVSFWAMKALCIGILVAGVLTRVYPRAVAAIAVAGIAAIAVWLAPLQTASNSTAAKATLQQLATAREGATKAQEEMKTARLRLKKLNGSIVGMVPEYQRQITDEIDQASQRMREADVRAHDRQANRVEFLRPESAVEKVRKQYIEWYAAMGWSLPRQKAFATGVGPGNYQLNIGPLYSSLPNEEKMPPDSNNLFLVQAVSLGFLGLGALLWIFGHFGRQAWLAMRRDWLGAGVLGSLCAFLLVNLFHALIVRGTGIVLAFVLSLAIIALQQSAQDQTQD